MNTPPIIALLTDFGTSDAYVGTMKGVMLTICPHAQLVDLTHAIAPQNVRQAAYVLQTAYRHFPPHTVFLVVVDPGVGTARDPIAAQTDHGCYVAPDNGVLSYVLSRLHVQHMMRLENSTYQRAVISHTFHGRDVFSPAAAHLAAGMPIDKLGPALNTWHILPQPTLTITPAQIDGEVLHIDHFGNIITSIGQFSWTDDMLRLDPAFGQDHYNENLLFKVDRVSITVGQHTLHSIRRTYGAVTPGKLIALIGSTGQLEISVNQGRAAQTLDVQIGDPVSLTLTT